MRTSHPLTLCVALLLTASLAKGQAAGPVSPPKPAPAGAAAPRTPAASQPATAPAAPIKPEEAEQLVAPVALYPDSLLAQVLMASTYPMEVVQAGQWLKQNPALKSSADALNKLTWDPSVKSLIDFPQVLTMMSEKLDWTIKLGDAFLADQKRVLDAIQRLRSRAVASGNLKSGDEVKVTVEAPATQPAGAASQVIVVEPVSPYVVYVPTYDPGYVYGSWPYPAYPPYYYYPPGYRPGAALVAFGIGVAVGAAWGHAWGDCNWGGGEVDIDIDRNVNFNNNIDRNKYKAELNARQANTNLQGSRDTRQAGRTGNARTFQHDPSHRQGVAYRDSATTAKYRGANTSPASAQAREAYRGRTDAVRTELSRGAPPEFRGSAPGAPAARGGSDMFGGTGTGSASRLPNTQARDYAGTRSSGLSGVHSSASSTRTASSRGQTSRSSSVAARPSTPSRSVSSGSRGGGVSRGGGGARGGGRR